MMASRTQLRNPMFDFNGGFVPKPNQIHFRDGVFGDRISMCSFSDFQCFFKRPPLGLEVASDSDAVPQKSDCFEGKISEQHSQ